MAFQIQHINIEDFDSLMELWLSVGMSKRALNPIDDSREGIERYLKRNPSTCFKVVTEDKKIAGVILSGHDGRRGTVHHLCVNPEYQGMGVGRMLVEAMENGLKAEGIQKIFVLVFSDNEKGNGFWQKMGYSIRTDLNYRNKSLNSEIPVGK